MADSTCVAVVPVLLVFFDLQPDAVQVGEVIAATKENDLLAADCFHRLIQQFTNRLDANATNTVNSSPEMTGALAD